MGPGMSELYNSLVAGKNFENQLAKSWANENIVIGHIYYIRA